MRRPGISRGFCDVEIFLVVFRKLEHLDSSAAHFCQVFDKVEQIAGLQAWFTSALATESGDALGLDSSIFTGLKEIVYKIIRVMEAVKLTYSELDSRARAGQQQLYYHDCSGRIPGHPTRAPLVGFELETNCLQFYAIANYLDKTSLR